MSHPHKEQCVANTYQRGNSPKARAYRGQTSSEPTFPNARNIGQPHSTASDTPSCVAQWSCVCPFSPPSFDASRGRAQLLHPGACHNVRPLHTDRIAQVACNLIAQTILKGLDASRGSSMRLTPRNRSPVPLRISVAQDAAPTTV